MSADVSHRKEVVRLLQDGWNPDKCPRHIVPRLGQASCLPPPPEEDTFFKDEYLAIPIWGYLSYTTKVAKGFRFFVNDEPIGDLVETKELGAVWL